MPGDEQAPEFTFNLSVPEMVTDEDRERAIVWLNALARQLEADDGKVFSVQVTGVFIDEYDEGEDEHGKKIMKKSADQKAAASFMVCPGKRPYA